ncbi:MAG TPA: hypothetical protein VIU65_03210 [Pyrinomonadaceae bacterium]
MGKSEKPVFDDEVDALFKLPLAEFTGARNALSAQLKKSGQVDEAVRVKTLAKPSVSAWAANQLYWNHRKDFDQLIALGERFHRAQKSGKVADMREVLEARREALLQLSDIAASVLREAAHSPAPDTIHRITTTLEGVSVRATDTDGPRPGRLTHDVDPPGFESFGSFVPRMRLVPPAATGGSARAKHKPTNPRATHDKVRPIEDTGKTRIAAAKASLQDAKKSLTEARVRAQGLEAAHRKADVEAKNAEKLRHDVEEELRKAKVAAENAAQLARSVAAELKDAARTVDAAEDTVVKTSKELESLLRKTSGK